MFSSGPQLAKQLDSWEDIVHVIITEVVDSEGLLLPSQVLFMRELVSEITSFLNSCSNRMS